MMVVFLGKNRASFVAIIIIIVSSCTGLIAGQGCGGTINISDTGNGSIQSPGFPLAYPLSINCTWYITTGIGRVVMFIVDTMSLPQVTNCSEHYVNFYDGLPEDNIIITSFEGCTETYQPPQIFTSTQSEASVVFSSGEIAFISSTLLYINETSMDLNTNATVFVNGAFVNFSSGDETSFAYGFHVDYEETILCGGILNASIPGWFTSDNYPDDYDNLQNCTWYIFAEGNALVELTILDFSLESQVSCNYDIVTIYDGDTTDPILFQECFSSILSPILLLSTLSYVTIVFETDSSITDSGFNISYTQSIGLETTDSHTTEDEESTTIATMPTLQTETTPTTYVTATTATGQTPPDSSTTTVSATMASVSALSVIATPPTYIYTATTAPVQTVSTANTPGIHGASTTAVTTEEPIYSTNTISQSVNTPATTSVTNGNHASTTAITTEEPIYSTDTISQSENTPATTSVTSNPNHVSIVCRPLPTWLNLEFDSSNHSIGDSVTYTCQDGYRFKGDSNQNEKHSECLGDGQWEPAFTVCEAIGHAAALALIKEPVEAVNAQAIGSLFIVIGLGIEIGILVLLDFHSIATNLKFCKRHVKRRSRKVGSFESQL